MCRPAADRSDGTEVPAPSASGTSCQLKLPRHRETGPQEHGLRWDSGSLVASARESTSVTGRERLVASLTRLTVSCFSRVLHHLRLVLVSNESDNSGNQRGKPCPCQPAGAQGGASLEAEGRSMLRCRFGSGFDAGADFSRGRTMEKSSLMKTTPSRDK